MAKTILNDEFIGASGQEALGSVKLFNGDLFEKVRNNRWVLTKERKDVTVESMATKTKTGSTSLIPNADKYFDEGLNVLLIGRHGTGKTVSIQDMAKKRRLKWKYYSCSTLDPYTDLVGVPTPRDFCRECSAYYKDSPLCPEGHGPTIESLRNVRPHELDDAELIFFDELNRAETKTLNAVFEIIQFGSLNGEKLKNLKACWAAINPPNDEMQYDVERLDPALQDRFDIYINIIPRVSAKYLSQHMNEHIAAVLYRWWSQHQETIENEQRDAIADYISPRRMEKLGLIWQATRDQRSVISAFPQGGNFSRQQLVDQLKLAQVKIDNGDKSNIDEIVEEEENDLDFGGAGIGDRPAEQFTYEKASMELERDSLTGYLEQYPKHLPTHKAVLEGLQQGVGGEALIHRFGSILNAIDAPLLEGYVNDQPTPKRETMLKGFASLYKDKPNQAKKLVRLHAVLAKTGSKADGFPDKL